MRLRCARCGCYLQFSEIYPGEPSPDGWTHWTGRVKPCARCLREERKQAIKDSKMVERALVGAGAFYFVKFVLEKVGKL